MDNPVPDHDETIKMCEAMQMFGGGFVKALSECFIIGDENNTRRLYAAFPEYVKLYREMAGLPELQPAQKGD